MNGGNVMTASWRKLHLTKFWKNKPIYFSTNWILKTLLIEQLLKNPWRQIWLSLLKSDFKHQGFLNFKSRDPKLSTSQWWINLILIVLFPNQTLKRTESTSQRWHQMTSKMQRSFKRNYLNLIDFLHFQR